MSQAQIPAIAIPIAAAVAVLVVVFTRNVARGYRLICGVLLAYFGLLYLWVDYGGLSMHDRAFLLWFGILVVLISIIVIFVTIRHRR